MRNKKYVGKRKMLDALRQFASGTMKMKDCHYQKIDGWERIYFVDGWTTSYLTSYHWGSYFMFEQITYTYINDEDIEDYEYDKIYKRVYPVFEDKQKEEKFDKKEDCEQHFDHSC